MQAFNIDTELRRHTTPRAIADAKKAIANQLVKGDTLFGYARVYAEIGLVGETAAHLLAYEEVPASLKWKLFMAALDESARVDMQWGTDHAWLVPKTAQRSISQALKTQQEIALLQLKMVTSSLGLSD